MTNYTYFVQQAKGLLTFRSRLALCWWLMTKAEWLKGPAYKIWRLRKEDIV